MGLPECVLERRRDASDVWHLAAGEGDSWWRPIACDDREGIVAPGPGYERQPTCVGCYRIWRTGQSQYGRVRHGEPCTDCDGRGHYTIWPHVTCPVCAGSGMAPDEKEEE